MRRRLSSCGLAASLDHTLRLAYSAQDGGDAHVASALRGGTRLAAAIVQQNLVPMLEMRPPTAATAVDGGNAAREGRSSESLGGHGDESSRPGAAAMSSSSSSSRAGHQLGLVLTASKRAAMLTRALEAAGAGAQGGDARGPGDGQGRQQILEWAADVTACLHATTKVMEEELLRMAGEAAQQGVAAVINTGDGGHVAACQVDMGAAAGCVDEGETRTEGEGGWGLGAECLDEAHEALALAARAACNLAAPLGWKLAADMAAAAAGGPTVQPAAVQAMGMVVVCEMATRLAHMCRSPALLPPAQLLACQPHRLLAAACTLAAALPTQPNELGEHKQRLCALLASAVAVLASHETLSGRARGWLAPPLAAAATSSDESCGGDGGGGGSRGSRGKGQQADPCAGCLAVPLLALVRQAAGTAPSYAAHTAALLRLAGGGEGTGVAPGEADGGFRRFAQGVAEAMVADSCRDAQPCGRFTEVPMPDGSSPTTLLPAEGEGNSAGGMRAVSPPSPLPAAPSTPLPPPLALQPSRQGALTRLRVCGNPHCSNFAGESEGALPFKQCGGCRAVRYCGADCQRAHWREGHRAECKELAAGATGV